MYQFWLHFLPACPGSWLISSLLAPLSGVGLMSCKVLRKAPFIFKILGRATASHLVLTKQISSYCQSKASENCRSQTRGSGFWTVIITVWNKKIYFKKKKRYCTTTFPWAHRTAEGPQSFCGKRDRFVIFLFEGTFRPHQPRWVHQCRFASSTGCNGHSSFAVPLWDAASSIRLLWR